MSDTMIPEIRSEAQDSVVEVRNLKKYFPIKRGFFSSVISGENLFVKAVDDVSFYVRKGEVFGLAGESGSGKTTTGRLMLRLTDVTDGKVLFKGRDITKIGSKELKPLRREMQIIFQDPYESLDPRMTIKEIVAEPVRIQGIAKTEEEVEERVKKILTEVEIFPPEEFMWRYPHELSGGQRQRVAVARAFIVDPEFVVADEPVSMLDVSIRASVLNVMLELVQKHQVSFIYITHDLALAKHVCDRLAVMYLGKIVEMGPTQRVIDSPLNPPLACRFNTRCPYAFSECTELEPPLIEVEPGHFVACHMVTKH